jgi:phycocyanobilin:ferredoxin oxidoreductase
MHPLVERLAGAIRDGWADLPELARLAVDPELEAISGSLDGEALFIRNELRRCRGLRKLHLETARLGLGLQILHCVWFPDPRYDLPVFGADIVASPAGVSAAIVDLSPVDDQLPPQVERGLAALPPRSCGRLRELPPWGTIFSPHVLFVRPENSTEETAFVDAVRDRLAVLAEAVHTGSPQASGDPATVRRWHGQLHYCSNQKRNDKTRRVLEKAFNPTWAERYIEGLLFDDPPAPSSCA